MLEVIGIDGVIANISDACMEGRRGAGPSLYRRAEEIMSVAKPRTPIDQGPLRASGYVEEPRETLDGDVEVAMGFGGPSADYAVIVHEDLEAHHDIGQAKYLESAVLERVPTLAEDVARDMEFE